MVLILTKKTYFFEVIKRLQRKYNPTVISHVTFDPILWYVYLQHMFLEAT